MKNYEIRMVGNITAHIDLRYSYMSKPIRKEINKLEYVEYTSIDNDENIFVMFSTLAETSDISEFKTIVKSMLEGVE